MSNRNAKIEPINTLRSVSNQGLIINIEDDRSSRSPLTSTIKPPLHPLAMKNKEGTFEEAVAANMKTPPHPIPAKATKQRSRSRLVIPTSEEELMSILVNKVMEDNVQANPEESK